MAVFLCGGDGGIHNRDGIALTPPMLHDIFQRLQIAVYHLLLPIAPEVIVSLHMASTNILGDATPEILPEGCEVAVAVDAAVPHGYKYMPKAASCWDRLGWD